MLTGFPRNVVLPRHCWGAAAALAALLASPAGAAPEDVLARGAYLARITGCVGCHTPRTHDGDVVEPRLMSGGDHPIPSALARIFPPNLTPDKTTGLGDW
jgi:hypothetical protein